MNELTNNLKKLASSLRNKKARDENNLFIVEGASMCAELLTSPMQTEFVIIRSNPDDKIAWLAAEFEIRNIPVYIARRKQFDQLVTTESPQGIFAVAKITETIKKDFGNFIVLEGISDPGNLGTIIRTADWFGFRTIFTGGSSVDKYNPKVVRSTMGSIFRCDIIYQEDLVSFLNENFQGCELYAATLTAKIKLEDCNPTGQFGIILGNEAHGISKELLKIVTTEYLIPGAGTAESLNVAVAAGISMYHFSL